jgi:hypothetical protein
MINYAKVAFVVGNVSRVVVLHVKKNQSADGLFPFSAHRL